MGDIIEWSCHKEFFSDYPASSHSVTDKTIKWEIRGVSNNGSLLIRSYSGTTYTENYRSVGLKIHWIEADFGGAISAGIFPQCYDGQSVYDLYKVDFSTLKMTFTDYGDYIRGYGIVGESYDGVDPLKTMWLETKFHKGTGIVYYAELYDDDDEHGYTNMETITTKVNFDMGKRPAYTNMTIAINADKTSGSPPLTVSFSVTASGGMSPYAYLWQFGDGEQSEEQNPTHTFTLNDAYTSRVIVWDAYRISKSDDIKVVVSYDASDNPDGDSNTAKTTGGGLPLGLIVLAEIITVAAVVAIAVMYLLRKGSSRGGNGH